MNTIRTFIICASALFSLLARGENAFDEIGRLHSMDREQAAAFIGGLEKSAEAGSQEAAFALRHLFSLEYLPNGDGEKSEFYSPEKAHRWNMELIGLSADKYPYMYRAGLDFFKGFAVKADAKKAAKHFGDVAEPFLDKKEFAEGDLNSDSISSPLCVSMKAAACLAYCLENGMGVKRDAARAKAIFEKISQTPNPSYLAAVAEIFAPFFGRGAEFADDINLYGEYSKAAKTALEKSAAHAGFAIAKTEAYSKMPADELESVDNPVARVCLAKKLLALNEKEFKSFDMFFVWTTVKYGFYDEENAPRALKILESEADGGNPHAALELGRLYATGNIDAYGAAAVNMPLDFNKEKAEEYYAKVLQNDNFQLAAKALEGLGDLALGISHAPETALGASFFAPDRRGIKPAMANYLKSAKLGNAGAMSKLATIYGGVTAAPMEYLFEPDEMASVYWLEQASGTDSESAYALGKMFLRGAPLRKDLARAAESMRLAMKDEGSKFGIMAAETYAGMCESGMVGGKSEKDADEIRRAVEIKDSDTAYSLCGIYADGVLKNEARWEGLLLLARDLSKEESGIKVMEGRSEPGYVQWQLEDIEKLKASRNAQNPRVLHLIGLLYESAIPKAQGSTIPALSDSTTAKKMSVLRDLAAEYFEKSAEGGYLPSYQALARISHYENAYLTADMEKTRHWCDLGIEKGDERSAVYKTLLSDGGFLGQIGVVEELARGGNRYAQDWFVIFASIMVGNDLKNDSYERLAEAEKYARGNSNTIKIAALKLAGAGTEKDVSGAVSILENIVKGPSGRSNAALLLAHVYSGKEEGFARDEKKYVKYLNMMKSSVSDPYALISFLDSNKGLNAKIAALAESVKTISKESETLWASSYFATPAYDTPLAELEKFAAEGSADAKYFAALAYASYDSENLNYEKAAKYARELVEKDPNNMKYLSIFWYLTRYGLGGVEKDEKLADSYLDRLFTAAETGDYDADVALTNLLSTNKMGRWGGYLSVENLFEGLCDRAMELARKNDKALFRYRGGILRGMLEVYSSNGFREKADEVLERLVARDRKEDYIDIARYCMKTPPPDYDRAFEYYDRAWKQGGDKYFAVEYGKLYFYGLGTEKDYKKAFEAFSSSKDQVVSVLWTMLCHEKGYGVEKSAEKASECFDKAMKLATSDAIDNQMYMFFHSGTNMMIGKTYDVTLGFPKEPELGLRLIRAAADAGYEDAKKYLGKNGM